MNLNIYSDKFEPINVYIKDILELDKYDPVMSVVRSNFQLNIAQYLASLNAESRKDPAEEIRKSSTILGSNIENAIEVQKEIYLDIGRKYACTIFMFDLVKKPIEVIDIQLFYEILFSEYHFRQSDAFLIDQSGLTHRFPRYQDIQSNLDKLIEEFKTLQEDSELHPLVIITYFHYRLLAIHPFPDGNGRISRLILNVMLENSVKLTTQFGLN
ncbi:hypothetical protein DYBT9275_01684 [Dyadobacter sp. CECT 9275]|uniref:Fido domain-containing protein n=1 Tax=Dyadobacter helix TaxID=2822344 RepID=A0A916JCK1_9BACT|nr:Fic family protein [Dyadobacter sp. CECT 9275]CAG4995628.1 hypothetical protein DYBT9275_01684 [Dyadobacter sp. CECT 9275]